MTELSLFDMPADWLPVRSCDPATSKRAARDLPIGNRRREVLLAMRFLAVASDAADIRACIERELGLVRERGEVASRLSELERLGCVRRCGVKQGPRGRAVSLWSLTSDGRAASE